jgi:hypothetical protein
VAITTPSSLAISACGAHAIQRLMSTGRTTVLQAESCKCAFVWIGQLWVCICEL